MIKIENIQIYGWEAALRGMRNPLNSWAKSDTNWEKFYSQKNDISRCIGENDLSLMKKLAKAGTDHRKYLRMINVTVDIIAPLYWWKEFDTYKVGTTANSCSTMHKVMEKEFTKEDFSTEHLYENNIFWQIIPELNKWRDKYLQSQSDIERKYYWWQIIQLLPTSYNQKRTVQLNYEVLYNMYKSRKEHKLDEWRFFCFIFILKLPYFAKIFDIEA